MEEEIIEFVRNNKILYHYDRNSTYKLRQRKWAELAKTLNTSVDAVKNKWRTLRHTYSKAVKRKKENRNAKIQWRFFESLKFLSDCKIDIFRNNNTPANTVNSINFSTKDITKTVCKPEIILLNNDDYNYGGEETNEQDKNCSEDDEYEAIESEMQAVYHDPQANNIVPHQDNNMQQYMNNDEMVHSHLMNNTDRTKQILLSKEKLFFASLAKTVEEGNLTTFQFLSLQRRVLETVEDFLVQSNNS